LIYKKNLAELLNKATLLGLQILTGGESTMVKKPVSILCVVEKTKEEDKDIPDIPEENPLL